MSQKALAGDRLTPSYVSLIEVGRRMPTLDVVVWLARRLSTTLQDLIGHDIQGLTADASASALSALSNQMEVRRLTETGDLDGARAALTAELARLREQGDAATVIDVGLELLDLLSVAGEPSDRLKLISDLAGLPAAAQSGAVQLSLLVYRASALRELGRLREARQAAQEATLLDVSAAPPNSDRVRTLGVLASVLCELGEFEQAELVVNEMLAVAAGAGQLGVLGRAHWVASMAYSRLDRADAAYEHLELSRKALAYENMPVRDWLRFCRFNARILLDTGHDQDEARAWIETAEMTATMAGLAAEKHSNMRERARYELAVGNTQAAAELYAKLVDDSANGSDRWVTLLGLGEALARLGNSAEAVERLRQAAEYCEESGNFREAIQIWRRIDQLRG